MLDDDAVYEDFLCWRSLGRHHHHLHNHFDFVSLVERICLVFVTLVRSIYHFRELGPENLPFLC